MHGKGIAVETKRTRHLKCRVCKCGHSHKLQSRMRHNHSSNLHSTYPEPLSTPCKNAHVSQTSMAGLLHMANLSEEKKRRIEAVFLIICVWRCVCVCVRVCRGYRVNCEAFTSTHLVQDANASGPVSLCASCQFTWLCSSRLAQWVSVPFIF